MKKKLLAALLMGVPFGANATIISGYGVVADSFTYDCPSYCPGPWGGDGQGGQFVTSATSADNTYGSARSYAAFDGSSYLPDLKVYSAADAGRRASATAMGSQGFTYTGTDTRSITLDISLHGIVRDNSNGSHSYNAVVASVAVITGNDMGWYNSWSTLVGEIATGERLGARYNYINSASGEYSPSSITFDLTPGLEFYVIASVNAESRNGFADAMHTLTLKFDNPNGLVAAAGGPVPNAVPLPAAALLFGTGVIGFVGARRRKSLQLR